MEGRGSVKKIREENWLGRWTRERKSIIQEKRKGNGLWEGKERREGKIRLGG